MPQMMPMWWSLHLLLILTFFIILISLIYFLSHPIPPYTSPWAKMPDDWKWMW